MARDDLFCRKCGTALADLRERAAAASPLAGAFTGLRSGEQRPVTLLMTDVCGFSGLSEDAEPEWVFQLLNEIFGELVDVLAAHGAHIDKYVGDEIIALFGVPLALEKAVEQALRASLAMRERLREQAERGRFGATRPRLHTGINLGPVMVGRVGHHTRRDYTVIGDAVNVTKRLEDEAPPGEVYVSDVVRQAGEELFRFDRIGSVQVKGRQQPLEVYRLLGTRRRGGTRTGAPGTPLVGRQSELRALNQYAQQAQTGRQTVVYLLGPAGIGKSRVLHEWLRSPSARGFRTITLASHVFGEHFPLLPLVDLVAQLAGLRVEDWPPRVAGEIEAAVGRLDLAPQHRERIVGLLRSLAQPPDSEEAPAPAALAEALVALLASVTRQRPLCVLLEDVQWLDEASRGVLREALLRGRSWPWFVLMTARRPPAELAPEEIGALTLPLSPLPLTAMEELIEAWAAPVLPSAAMKRAICEAAQGHPFFARELVRSMTAAPGQTPSGGLRLPNSVQELLLSQLDTLPGPLRHLVQAASVIGEPLSGPLVEASLEEEREFSENLLSQAIGAGLLRTGAAPGQFVFGRRLLFEAAYETIPPSQRRALHARVAGHLQEAIGHLGEASVHTLAHHAYLGYHDERALEPLLRSARLYRTQYANRQAVRSAGRALELISALPDPEKVLGLRLECLLLTAQSYQVLGELDSAEGALAEAEALAETCADDELVARLLTAGATLHLMRGQFAEAEAGLGRARAAWESLGQEERVGHALLGLGLCARHGGRVSEAFELFAEAAQRSGSALWVQAAALNNAGVLLLVSGRYAEAEPYLQQGLDANRADGDRRGVAHSQASLGELYLRLGRCEEAERRLQAALADAEEIEDAQCSDLALALLARVAALQGRTEETPARLAYLAARRTEAAAEVLAHCRMAELEANVAEQLGDAGTEPGLAPRVCQECPDLYAELLCVELETALARGEEVATLATALEEQVAAAPDQHLQSYARWLLAVASGEGPTVPPGPEQPGQPESVFALRSRRLREALARLPSRE